MFYLFILQVVKIHDCVGCHNKGEPKLVSQYELENLSENKTIQFTVTVFLDDKDKVFFGDLADETTEFIIENPIVGQQ